MYSIEINGQSVFAYCLKADDSSEQKILTFLPHFYFSKTKSSLKIFPNIDLLLAIAGVNCLLKSNKILAIDILSGIQLIVNPMSIQCPCKLEIGARCIIEPFANAYRSVHLVKNSRMIDGIAHPASLMGMRSTRLNGCPTGEENRQDRIVSLNFLHTVFISSNSRPIFVIKSISIRRNT